jgi:ubiquinone/menaquinone biosynthesis C-methylase UbiE
VIKSKHEAVREYYSLRAKAYDQQKVRTWQKDCGFETEILEKIKEKIDKNSSPPILELGVGTGRVAMPLIKSKMVEITGIDLCIEMIRLARKKAAENNCEEKLRLHLADLENIPFQDKTFRTIICISTLHYLDHHIALSEIYRILLANGFLLLGDLCVHEEDESGFLQRIEKSLSPVHREYFKISILKNMLQKFGFEVLETEIFKYPKKFQSLVEDKASYFPKLNLDEFYKRINNATPKEKRIYGLREDSLSLYYGLIYAQKTKLVTPTI